MEPVAANVAYGRDPAWREAWEERLDEASRQMVRDAVRDGTAVMDPNLWPFLAGLIARRRRRLRSSIGLWVVTTVTTVFWVYSTTVRRPSLFAIFWIVMLLACLILVPLRLRSARRALARCEAAQAELSRDEA